MEERWYSESWISPLIVAIFDSFSNAVKSTYNFDRNPLYRTVQYYLKLGDKLVSKKGRSNEQDHCIHEPDAGWSHAGSRQT